MSEETRAADAKLAAVIAPHMQPKDNKEDNVSSRVEAIMKKGFWKFVQNYVYAIVDPNSGETRPETAWYIMDEVKP